MTLKDFRVEFYPNSDIPKSYGSSVSIQAEGGVARDVKISMNKPLRFKNLTFFQSSYIIGRDGSEYTILAVVKNVGRLLPLRPGGTSRRWCRLCSTCGCTGSWLPRCGQPQARKPARRR